MKKILSFITITILLISGACSSTNKSGDGTDHADTAGYMEQPADKTQVNDSLPLQNPDSVPK